MTRLKIHPVAELFPQMKPDEFSELKADILKNGVRQPATIFKGQVADGRSRHEAWCALVDEGKDVGEFPTSVFAGNEEELLRHVWSANVTRRHLDSSQRAMLAAQMAPRFEELAKARQRAGGLASDEAKGKSSEKAAELSGASKASTERAIAIRKRGDESLTEAVADGTVTVSDAAKIIDQPKAVQRAAVKAVKDGMHKTATGAVAAGFGAGQPSGDEPAAPVDALATPLPTRLIPIFEDGKRLSEVDRLLSQAIKIVKEVGDLQAGVYLSPERILTDLNNAKQSIKLSKPYAVCGECRGKGCKSCKMKSGFVSKAVYERSSAAA